jgi:tetratricopeptide (TPR) repeat protein
VVLPSGQFVTQRVRLVVSYLTNPGITYYTDNNGGFGFSGLGEGAYTIEATGDTRLYETVSQEVRVARGMHLKLVIHLKERGKPADTKTENVVSLAELKQKVPDPAKKEFEKATRLVSEGKLQEAIPQYKKALVIFPEYLMARNDLGVQYLKLKRIEEAVEQFEAALEVDSKVFNPRLNLGIAMVEQKRFLEAKDHLNQAISLDSSSPSAHLYLGIASTEIDELEAAERELSAAYTLGGEQYAVVHYYKANVHMKRGEREAAIRELTAYLGKFPSGDHADNARTLLEKLK